MSLDLKLSATERKILALKKYQSIIKNRSWNKPLLRELSKATGKPNFSLKVTILRLEEALGLI